MDVLVEVERRDDHHGDGLGDARARELSGRFDSVAHRHAHVEQAHVGAQRSRELDGGRKRVELSGLLEGRELTGVAQ
jgi:hypothetical protein